jgi:hypothetical protein
MANQLAHMKICPIDRAGSAHFPPRTCTYVTNEKCVQVSRPSHHKSETLSRDVRNHTHTHTMEEGEEEG